MEGAERAGVRITFSGGPDAEEKPVGPEGAHGSWDPNRGIVPAHPCILLRRRGMGSEPEAARAARVPTSRLVHSEVVVSHFPLIHNRPLD